MSVGDIIYLSGLLFAYPFILEWFRRIFDIDHDDSEGLVMVHVVSFLLTALWPLIVVGAAIGAYGEWALRITEKGRLRRAEQRLAERVRLAELEAEEARLRQDAERELMLG